jgi:hypothetical protein
VCCLTGSRDARGKHNEGGAPDAEGVTEGDEADALDKADAGVGALQLRHRRCARLKHQPRDVPARAGDSPYHF